MRKIAILMTCYNRAETTLVCLRRLQQCFAQCENCAFDIWLVDDASPDGTGERVKMDFPNVNIIMGTGKLFWCKGMRLAWDRAIAGGNQYDFYLWLNDDVELKGSAIAQLLQDVQACGRADGVIVGTLSDDYSEGKVSYGAMDEQMKVLTPIGDPRRSIGFLNGNCVLIPQGAFQRVGPIYGGYNHAYGDFDYGFRLKQAGIPFFASSRFVGVCPRQPNRYAHLSGLSVWSRCKLLFQAKGYSIHDTFLYRLRNFGLMRAIVSVCHVVVCVILGKELHQ